MCGTHQGGPLSPNMFRYMPADLKKYLKLEHGIVLDDEVLVHIFWADEMVLMLWLIALKVYRNNWMVYLNAGPCFR